MARSPYRYHPRSVRFRADWPARPEPQMMKHPSETLCPEHRLPLERRPAVAKDSRSFRSTKPTSMLTACAVIPWKCPECDYTIDEAV
jgi:hypothetical protein